MILIFWIICKFNVLYVFGLNLYFYKGFLLNFFDILIIFEIFVLIFFGDKRFLRGNCWRIFDVVFWKKNLYFLLKFVDFILVLYKILLIVYSVKKMVERFDF